MVNTLFLPELREMLAEEDHGGLSEFSTALHPVRLAEYMEGLTADEVWSVLKHADVHTRVEIFTYLDHDRQVEVLETQDQAAIAALIAELAPDDRVDMLSGVEDRIVQELLARVPVDERRDILRLSAYPEETAGAVMTTEVARFSETLTAQEALDQL
ncbi:MAG: magnesium transporter, partial [Planctomycetes bacterium]|nr:magnesium transporter [Planctomycetota bacterium]